MMKHRPFIPLIALCFAAATSTAFAAGEGKAVGVNPDAKATINATDRILEVGADVSVGEMIVTGTAGQVQIVFADYTRLVVGPRSSLLIERYLMASSNTAQQLAINALGGSFRFISGNSPKSAYSIHTPTASIAVRGTEFDIITEPGSTGVMLYEGALEICNPGGDCEQVSKRCDVAVATGEQATLYSRDDAERTPLSLLFRYARFQAPLLPEFRVSGAALCAEDPAISAQSSDSSSSTPVPPQGQGQGQRGQPGAQGPGVPIR